MTKIYSVSISEQLLFDVCAIFILFHYKDIKTYKFPNTALQLPSVLRQIICFAEYHDLSPLTKKDTGGKLVDRQSLQKFQLYTPWISAEVYVRAFNAKSPVTQNISSTCWSKYWVVHFKEVPCAYRSPPRKSKRLWKMEKITFCFDKCAALTLFYFNKKTQKKKVIGVNHRDPNNY